MVYCLFFYFLIQEFIFLLVIKLKIRCKLIWAHLKWNNDVIYKEIVFSHSTLTKLRIKQFLVLEIYNSGLWYKPNKYFLEYSTICQSIVHFAKNTQSLKVRMQNQKFKQTRLEYTFLEYSNEFWFKIKLTGNDI